MQKKHKANNISPGNLKLTRNSLILGIGNPIKQDDGAGPLLIQELQGKVPCHLINCETAPENYISKIRKLAPDKIIIVDALDSQNAPGTIKIYGAKDIVDESFSTHGISIKVLADFIKSESEAEIIIVGINPEALNFGKEMSEPVKEAVKKLAKDMIKSCTN